MHTLLKSFATFLLIKMHYLRNYMNRNPAIWSACKFGRIYIYLLDLHSVSQRRDNGDLHFLRSVATMFITAKSVCFNPPLTTY